jgi:nicotinamide phosphoribosyltransferase
LVLLSRAMINEIRGVAELYATRERERLVRADLAATKKANMKLKPTTPLLRKSRVIDTDFYKTTQPRMYSPDVTGIFSYAESRGGEYKTVILYGLQGFIKEKLLTPVTKEDVDYADFILTKMGGFQFDRTAWDIVVNEYNGFIPVTIKAVKEGMKIPYQNAVVTVECTDPRLFSLVGYIETALLRAVWFPSTIASRVYQMKKNIDALYARYADTTATSDFSFLDFSGRGVESQDASEVGSAAFLTSFLGTDTCAGVAYVYDYYGNVVIGGSVAASEHSVMCSYGESNEFASFKHIIEGTPEGSIVSVVSDTWNIYNACRMWNKLADTIKAKKLSLVIRPDSGEPEEVLPAMLAILEEGFPTHRNDKGLKVFDNLKLLWGDGIDETNYLQVLGLMPKNGFGVEVLILGSGGGLMQKVNRDTMKWAFKASAVMKNNSWCAIRKDPITDPGKKSKAGKLETIFHKKKKEYGTVDWTLAAQLGTPLLEVVYCNGQLMRDQTQTEIRELVAA